MASRSKTGDEDQQSDDVGELREAVRVLYRKLEAADRRSPDKRNGHVSLAREEYDALVSREDSHAELAADNARINGRLVELMRACDVQARSISELTLTVDLLKRVNALQGIFVDALRADGGDQVCSLQELSEFWRQWTIQTGNAVKDGKARPEDVTRHEPDIFRTWKNWVRDSGRNDRMIGMSGTLTRAEYDSASRTENPSDRALRILREENDRHKERIAHLESEIAQHKASGQRRTDAGPDFSKTDR